MKKKWEVTIEYNGGYLFKYTSDNIDKYVAIAIATKELMHQFQGDVMRIHDVMIVKVKGER